MKTRSLRSKIAWTAVILGCQFAFINCQPMGANAPSSADESSNGAGPGPGGNATGLEATFNSQVKPVLESRCSVCHTEPRSGGLGPLTIFNYTFMKSAVLNGSSATDNELINKMRGLTTHTGGNVCAGGLTQTPCLEVISWGRSEREAAAQPGTPTPTPTPRPGDGSGNDGGGTPSGNTDGNIDYINEVGRASGYALDVSITTRKSTVYFYVDGPAGQGRSAGSAIADGFGIGPADGHAYIHQIPEEFLDGKPHKLCAYVDSTDAKNMTKDSPKTFTGYYPKAAGEAYCKSKVEPLFQNRCARCHFVDYMSFYYPLLNPTKATGGTATNNTVINKISGSTRHSGGTHCSSKNASPCTEIQEWWRLEFGAL